MKEQKHPVAIKMKCHKESCGWEWNTLSRASVVTCPGCGNKVKKPETKIKKGRGRSY